MSAGPSDDLPGSVEDDVQKFRELRQRDGNRSIPALIEGAFAMLLGLCALAWFASMWWVPDTISGTEWMGFGGLIAVMFGLPAGAIYWLRRGGVEVIQALIRQLIN